MLKSFNIPYTEFKSRVIKKPCKVLIYRVFTLSDQESNLDSSDPESDVLPITPSDNLGVSMGVKVVWVWGVSTGFRVCDKRVQN